MKHKYSNNNNSPKQRFRKKIREKVIIHEKIRSGESLSGLKAQGIHLHTRDKIISISKDGVEKIVKKVKPTVDNKYDNETYNV